MGLIYTIHKMTELLETSARIIRKQAEILAMHSIDAPADLVEEREQLLRDVRAETGGDPDG